MPPWGVNDGDPGKRARKIVERVDGTSEIVGNKVDDIAVKAGDQLHFVTWGGGGWGDPFERDPALVGKEIRQGLVTPDGAREYGVVADSDGVIDENATKDLRKKLSSERKSGKIFNYGPSVEELRASCEEDTGLPAPIQPVWHHNNLAEAAE